MDEEQQTQKEEQPTEDTGDGNTSETLKILNDANAVVKRMEEANKRAEQLLAENQKIMAINTLSGEAEAAVPKPKEKEIPLQEYADKFSRGELGNPFKEE